MAIVSDYDFVIVWFCICFMFYRYVLLLTQNVALTFVLFLSAILVYRGLRYARKRSLKISHASIFGAIMFLVIIASWAVYDSHVLNTPPIPNLYSLHSWIGLTAVILFMLQVNTIKITPYQMHSIEMSIKMSIYFYSKPNVLLRKFSVDWWILFILISNHNGSTASEFHAIAHLFWPDWIHHGNCGRSIGIMREDYFQIVIIAFTFSSLLIHLIRS